MDTNTTNNEKILNTSSAEHHHHHSHHSNSGHHKHHKHHKKNSSSSYEKRRVNVYYKQICKNINMLIVKPLIMTLVVLAFFWLLISAVSGLKNNSGAVTGLFDKEENYALEIEVLEKEIIDLKEYIFNIEKRLSKYEKVTPYDQTESK